MQHMLLGKKAIGNVYNVIMKASKVTIKSLRYDDPRIQIKATSDEDMN